jgi:hypothetical protein
MWITRFLAMPACLFLLMMSPAFADDQPIKLCKNSGDTCYQELVQAITNTFPLLDPTDPSIKTPATAGSNWCFETETDPTTNWWYFTHKDYTYAHSSDGGIRIKLTYQNPSTGSVAFASIFIALDLLRENDYGSQTVRALQVIPVPIGQGSTITFPDPTTNPCGGLEDFIKGLFLAYAPSWALVAEPYCTAPCGTTTIGGRKYDNIQLGEANRAYPLYWRFNEKTHTISGAMRFVVQFSGGPYDGQYGLIWVGYGGAGSGG